MSYTYNNISNLGFDFITIVVMDVDSVPYVGHDDVEPTASLISITFNACYMFN